MVRNVTGDMENCEDIAQEVFLADSTKQYWPWCMKGEFFEVNAVLLFVRIKEYSNIFGDKLLDPEITIPMGSV